MTAQPLLQTLTAALALIVLVLITLHVLAARPYRGHRRGRAIAPRVVLPAYLSALLLGISSAALLSLYVHRLLAGQPHLSPPENLLLALAAFAALFWSGFVGADSRRREVAVKLASVPCFGNGEHAAAHQLLPCPKSPMLSFSSLFIAPAPSPVRTVSSGVSVSATEQTNSPESTPDRTAHSRRSSTAGITKRKIWEFSCRSAGTWVYGRAKRQAWPLNVVQTYRTKGKRFLLVKDETVQDGAGAVLLDPAFTHSRTLDKPLIARAVMEAMRRSTPCVLHSWNRRFEGRLFHRFSQIPAVISILTGDLRCSLERRGPGSRQTLDDQERCYLTELLWAVVTVEVLDYLQYKRRDVPLLTWLVRLPQWLCRNDAGRVESEVDALFDAWKAGRNCGKSLARPCDSECCCHGMMLRSGCGCQCPCICSCA